MIRVRVTVQGRPQTRITAILQRVEKRHQYQAPLTLSGTATPYYYAVRRVSVVVHCHPSCASARALQAIAGRAGCTQGRHLDYARPVVASDWLCPDVVLTRSPDRYCNRERIY